SYGRNAFDHFRIAIGKLLPDTEVVSEAWPKLGTTDFTAHITKTISAKPDLLVSSVWGGDYIAFYKQALGYGLFEKMKFASTIAFGVAPHGRTITPSSTSSTASHGNRRRDIFRSGPTTTRPTRTR